MKKCVPVSVVLFLAPVLMAITAPSCNETTGDILSDAVDDEFPGQPVVIAAGRAHACAIYTSGQVYCWGAGDRGQLGNGSFESSAEPVRVEGICNG